MTLTSQSDSHFPASSESGIRSQTVIEGAMNPKSMYMGRASFGEFISLIAMMSCLVALSIDAMLPALPAIGQDLKVTGANDAQLVISALFIGISIGPLFLGPLSDSIGRKRAIYIGLSIFTLGTLLCLFAQNFEQMLVGRALQGFGAAGPRIVSIAMVRDQFVGASMARVMSFVTAVFIVVPAVAPSVGQLILLVSDWRGIFAFFLLLTAIILVWFAFRQDESLPVEKRKPYRVRQVVQSIKAVLSVRSTVLYALATGFLFGGFLGYLSSAQQVFQNLYGTGEWFPIYFAVLALGFGCASVVNGKMVLKHGTETMSGVAIKFLQGFAWTLLASVVIWQGIPPFIWFMVLAGGIFMSVAVVFGNLNAMAMQPLGNYAGVGAAVVSAISTLVSLPLGVLVGQSYNDTVVPLALGFTLYSFVAWMLMRAANRQKHLANA
mgnify:FL=1